MTATGIVAALGLAAWLYLVLLHGQFWLSREREEHGPPAGGPEAWPRIAAVIPARNEADMLPRSLASLVAQDYPGEFSLVLVDDQSSDGTADVARRVGQSAKREMSVIAGAPPPPGWSGKVWAMHQGIAAANSVEIAAAVSSAD